MIIELKEIVEVLLSSLPRFVNVLFFLIFVYSIFAILGMHHYNNQFHNRCRYSPTPEEPGVRWDIVEGDDKPCTKNGLGLHKCDPKYYCGNPFEYGIPLENEDIVNNEVIFYGITTYNNMFSSMLLVNQFISTDNWSAILKLMMGVDHPAIAVIYSLFMILIGTFFILNLILAVIFDTYVEKRDKRNRLLRLKFH